MSATRMLECRRRDLLALAAFFVFFFLYFNIHALHSDSLRVLEDHFSSVKEAATHGRHHEQHPKSGGEGDPFDAKSPANETLGFGAIVAVSKQGSKRRKGLLEGARLTDLQITIPEQPKWSEADIMGMKDAEYSIISRGSAMAWLGHLNAIKWFVKSGLETALIIEDDVDWDIHIRNHQVPLVASNVRKLLSATPANRDDHYASIREHDRKLSYWGDLTQWEVLYIGHCGDYFDLKYFPDLPHKVFEDHTVPDPEYMHPDTVNWLRDAGIMPKQRIIHRSKQPLCSFAYALNRKSAERMLAELSHEEKGHGTWSFDVRLLEACRDMGWKCWTANPELFHHQDEHDSAIADVDGEHLFEMDDDEGWDGWTPNIECGARSPRFTNLDRDHVEVVKNMAQHVGVCSMDDLRKINSDLVHNLRKDPF